MSRARLDFLHNNPLAVPHEDDPHVTPPPPGSKPPGNLSAEHLADLEVAFVGNLMDYCLAMGTIPPLQCRCFWRSNTGEVIGLRPSSVSDGPHGETYPELSRVVSHLRAYAGEVVGTPGIGDVFRAGEMTRDCSRFYYDKPDTDYRPVRDVAAVVGRDPRTVRRWVECQWVDCIQDSVGEVIVDLNSAIAVRDILAAKQMKTRQKAT